jgi:hypothetical protein
VALLPYLLLELEVVWNIDELRRSGYVLRWTAGDIEGLGCSEAN